MKKLLFLLCVTALLLYFIPLSSCPAAGHFDSETEEGEYQRIIPSER